LQFNGTSRMATREKSIQFGEPRGLREKAAVAEIRGHRLSKLLERAAQVVDSIVGMARIDDLEDHVVAGF
jgi:hypothetical protein